MAPAAPACEVFEQYLAAPASEWPGWQSKIRIHDRSDSLSRDTAAPTMESVEDEGWSGVNDRDKSPGTVPPRKAPAEEPARTSFSLRGMVWW